MAAAIGYAHTRVGDIAFAVRTDHRFYGYRSNHDEWSASVVKAMLMVAYLDQPSVANRPINSYDASLLVPMITQSDNNAATTVRSIVGNGGLQALADRVGMTALRDRRDLGRDRNHSGGPDEVLLQHRQLHHCAPPRLRHAPAGVDHPVAAVGDR